MFRARFKENLVNKLLTLWSVVVAVCASGLAHAQDLTDVIAEGTYGVLGGETVSASATLPGGWAPINDQVTFVYDPNFYFFMRGYLTDPQFDRRAENSAYGYVVVYAAGDPGGNYQSTPAWITHDRFSAAHADGEVELTYRYDTSRVPTFRGYQNFVVYTNLKKTSPASSLQVYDDELSFGGGNYLLTGDGPEQAVRLLIQGEPTPLSGRAIEVHTERSTPGSHWKLMLFARGSAAAFNGIDLRAYSRLAFYARASKEVFLQGGFGTGDDSGQLGFTPLHLTTSYQRFEFDLSGIDRSDVNTLLWVYLHKSLNGDVAGVSVYLDGIELLADVAPDAGPIVVDRGSDGHDGACSEGARTGQCNLRAALALVAGRTGSIQVEVDASFGSALRVPAGSHVTITGSGAQKELAGAGWGRLLDVDAGAALTLENLAIRSFSSNDGGAVRNAGELTLRGVLVAENSATCSGVGAMTAYATCWGGAVANYGKLVLGGDTRFEGNVTQAQAWTASFTNASATGGAITNNGELVIDGPVTFSANTADAMAMSGVHPSGLAGANASAIGGAIFSGGRIAVVGAGIGNCVFSDNSAVSTADTPFPGTTSTALSSGGALAASGEVDIPEGACSFRGNAAAVDPDLHVTPH
jgi:hypothetical protein